MRELNMKSWISCLVAVLGASLLTGCATTANISEVPPAPTVASKPPELNFGSMPGLATPTVTDPTAAFMTQAKVVVDHTAPPRKDPFALTASEHTFDVNQGTARITSEMGSFPLIYEVPPEVNPQDLTPIYETQPYRRLSGIIVGDSVYAILEDGSGEPEIIRPGMRIPNTEWTVVSIDLEKAVLRRNGNVLPHTVVVRLESPPPGMGGGTNTGGGQPGGPSVPGGPPGGSGMPGRPGGGNGRGGFGGK